MQELGTRLHVDARLNASIDAACDHQIYFKHGLSEPIFMSADSQERNRPFLLADVSSYFTTPPPKILAEAYTEILSKSEGNIPCKAMLDISLFAPVLPFTAIFAVEGNEKSVYRLVGEAWKQRIGMNPTGMNYFEMVPESNRPTAIAMSRTIIDTPCGLRLLTQQFDEIGPNAVTELLCLPLGSDEPEVDGFILDVAAPRVSYT